MKKILFILLLSGLLGAALFWVPVQNRFIKGACPFCKEEVREAQAFYESDLALGILTYKPAVPGHVLVIPKRHVERFEELTEAEMGAIQDLIRKVQRAEKELFGKDDYLLIQKNGLSAGQSVPHLHFHYLPRTPSENHALFSLRFFLSPYWSPESEIEMKETARRIRAAIDSSGVQRN